MLRDPSSSNGWQKLWSVVRRPYLHLYDNSKETEELMAINLSTIRVEQSPEIEQMLGVRFSLTFRRPTGLTIRFTAEVFVRHLHSKQFVLSSSAKRTRTIRLDQQDFVVDGDVESATLGSSALGSVFLC